MVDENGNQLPTIPILGPMQPWINLVHMVGMPWVIIVLSVWFGIPFAKDIADTAKRVEVQQTETNKRMDALDGHATKAMPLLERSVEAIPLLEAIHKTAKDGAAERHHDFKALGGDSKPLAKGTD